MPAALRKIKNLWSRSIGLSSNKLNLLVSVYIALLLNDVFWQKTIEAQAGFNIQNSVALVGLFILISGFAYFLLSVFAWRKMQKPIIMLLLLISTVCAYLIDHYGVFLDDQAIQSAMESDRAEAMSWISWQMPWYLLVWFGLPVLLLSRVQITKRRLWIELAARCITVIGLLLSLISAY